MARALPTMLLLGAMAVFQLLPRAWISVPQFPSRVSRGARAKKLQLGAQPETVDVIPEDTDASDAVEDELQELLQLQQEGDISKAEDLVYDLIDKGRAVGAGYFNTVMEMCLQLKEPKRAEKWFFRMQALQVDPNMETYNTMLRAAADEGDTDQAEKWFTEAYKAVGVDAWSYKFVLEALRNGGQNSNLETWFEHMLLAKVTPNVECMNSMLGNFADMGNLEKMEEWLAIAERLKIPLNVESYNLAMTAYLAKDQPWMAEELMDEMAESPELEPNAESYALLIGNGTSYRTLGTIERWSQALLQSGVELTPEAYTSVIGAFSGAGEVEQAVEWYTAMVEEDKEDAAALELVVEALMLSKVAENGVERADEFVEEFRAAGKRLSCGVFAALASADVVAGDFEQVEMAMQRMEAEGILLDSRGLTAMLLAYGNAQPQQSMLAGQMFKQQVYQGHVKVTREVLLALRAAVGGARCLRLRRELKIGEAPKNALERVQPEVDKRLTQAGLELVGLAVPKSKQPVRTWE